MAESCSSSAYRKLRDGMSGDRAYSVWRMSGDGQRSVIKVVGEEEEGAYNSHLAPYGAFWSPSFKFHSH